MMNNNNNDNNDNRIELIGLNEFIQDDEDDIELGDADFDRPFPDSDEAIRALQDIAESVYELEAECYRLRAELKTSNAERDAALAVVNEFVSDTTTNNETPDHECEFSHSPETGKCDACEAWGDYVGLFCSRTDEEETQ
jgi:hypothetical protein